MKWGAIASTKTGTHYIDYQDIKKQFSKYYGAPDCIEIQFVRPPSKYGEYHLLRSGKWVKNPTPNNR